MFMRHKCPPDLKCKKAIYKQETRDKTNIISNIKGFKCKIVRGTTRISFLQKSTLCDIMI